MKLKSRTRRTITYICIIIVFAILVLLLINNISNNIVDDLGNNDAIIVDEPKNEDVISEKTQITLGLIDVDTFNPILTHNSDVVNFLKLVYQSLFEYSADMHLISNIVDEYNYNQNNLYIKLKDNIHWHEGNLLTSDDVIFTVDQIKKYGGIYKENVENIDKVEKIDDLTFNIVVKNRNTFTQYDLTFPIISANYYATADFEDTNRSMKPNGTGIYKFDIYENSLYKFVYNDMFNDKVQINSINVSVYDNVANALVAIKNKSIDMMFTGITNFDQYIGTIGYKNEQYIDNTYVLIGINTENKYLMNKNFRKAVNRAIDREEISNNVYNNYCYISQSLIYPNSYLYKTIDEPYDIDKAKQLMKNYSVSNLSLNLLVNSNNNENVKLANIIKTQLNKIGINVIINSKGNSEYNSLLESKKYDLVVINYNIDSSIDVTNYVVGENDIFNIRTQEYMDILVDTNNDNIKNKFSLLQESIKENVPYLGIAYKVNNVLYNTNIFGVVNARYTNLFNNISEFYKKI